MHDYSSAFFCLFSLYSFSLLISPFLKMNFRPFSLLLTVKPPGDVRDHWGTWLNNFSSREKVGEVDQVLLRQGSEVFYPYPFMATYWGGGAQTPETLAENSQVFWELLPMRMQGSCYLTGSHWTTVLYKAEHTFCCHWLTHRSRPNSRSHGTWGCGEKFLSFSSYPLFPFDPFSLVYLVAVA